MKLKDIVSLLPNFYDETIRLDIISSATDECIYKIDELPMKYLKDNPHFMNMSIVNIDFVDDGIRNYIITLKE